MSKVSTSPRISTPSEAAGVLDFFLAGFAGLSAAGASFVVSGAGEYVGISGARISGVGPEKSLPVIRDNVCISATRLAM